MPTSSPTTCSSSATAVGADRLLFRLQRRAGLRRRHLPQCLVLREGRRFNITKARAMLQAYEGVRPLSAGRARCDAHARARRGAALPAHPRLRLAEHADGARSSAPRTRTNTCASCASISASILSRLRPREALSDGASPRSSSTPTAPAPAIRAPAAGARSSPGRASQGALRRRGDDHQQPHGADGRDRGARGAEARLGASSCTPTRNYLTAASPAGSTAGRRTAGAPPTRSR